MFFAPWKPLWRRSSVCWSVCSIGKIDLTWPHIFFSKQQWHEILKIISFWTFDNLITEYVRRSLRNIWPEQTIQQPSKGLTNRRTDGLTGGQILFRLITTRVSKPTPVKEYHWYAPTISVFRHFRQIWFRFQQNSRNSMAFDNYARRRLRECLTSSTNYIQ